MHRAALQRGAGFGIQPVDRRQAQDRAGVELIGIAAQPVEPGGGNIDQPLLGAGARFGAGISRRRRGILNRSAQQLSGMFAVPAGQIAAQHRRHAQHEARGDHRAGLIAPRPAQHDVGRTHCAGQIMRGQADAEIGARHAEMAQHCRRQQRVGRRRAGPGALGQPGTDHQVGAGHPRLQQAVNSEAGMAAPWRAHGDAVHFGAQQCRQFARAELRADFASGVAQILDEPRQRAAIGSAPYAGAAQRLGSSDQAVDQVSQRGIVIGEHQRGEDRLDAVPPCGEPRRPKILPLWGRWLA